ncbi:putative late blight resistance protein homolog R1A-3 [Henckelia pumila]|uniref:putative late blight resistance protein homolog R1A-3 n=1 Tax=Henckelia pumila TaxID=405737 RepID=UPI003C6E2FF7
MADFDCILGNEGFMIYALDATKEEKLKVSNIPVVKDFPDVFPDEIPGFSPQREIDLSIELMLGTSPIFRAPYRLAPAKLKELKTQLQELLEKKIAIESRSCETSAQQKPNSLLKVEASNMAAAYSALMSLMHTSEMIMHPSQQWLRIHRNMIGSLLQKVRLLQEFLEDYSHRAHQEMAGLERQIADMAYAAEDVIESHVLDQVLARSTGSEAKSSTSFSQYIHKVIEEMEDLMEDKLMRIKETIGKSEEDPTFTDFSPAVPSRSAAKENTTMMGADEKLNELLDILTGQQSNRQMVAIVGMGGIGKTTLAKYVYEHPLNKHHFDIRAWATISQKHSARKIISEMLSEIGQSRAESPLGDGELGQQSYKSEEKGDDERLGEQLHKSLCGRRYLIVMDDLWSTDAWYAIKRFFPDHGCSNGSRILITTREGNVVADLSSCRPFEMEFLNADRSWELLSEKVFGDRECPPELEKLGKTIAKNCGGLPLAIVVIGGLLAKSDKTTLSWKHVAENLNSIINSEDKEKCLEILYLSYNNLPIHLKPCFLYLAMAREGPDIHDIPSLIKIWVSEGFLKPISDKSLEEAANEYITDLIDRNLIFVRSRGDLGELHRCGIHDLLRDLCLREAQKINLCGVIDLQNPAIPSEIKFMRGIGFGQASLKPKRYIPCGLELEGQASLTRSIIYGSDSTQWYTTNFRLLRLFRGIYLPDEILQLMNLRFMSFQSDFVRDTRFISSISLFWNIQTLHVHVTFEPLSLPPEIWILPHLRHLECSSGCVLPDPPADHHILENLQTLSTVVNFRCSEEACTRLPNLKKLDVIYDRLPQGVEYWTFLQNLAHLQKLQSLYFSVDSPISWEHLSFPPSLKKLTISGCSLPWEDMSIVGSLPNLELLRLWSDPRKRLTWCPIQGQFVRLKVLQIADIDLVHWRADNTHFPVLQHLILRHLNLEEFPQDFGEHPTLGKIEVFYCSDSTKAWAEQIGEEQESFGNDGFRVEVHERKDNRNGSQGV